MLKSAPNTILVTHQSALRLLPHQPRSGGLPRMVLLLAAFSELHVGQHAAQ
jgi:hypothetical protein